MELFFLNFFNIAYINYYCFSGFLVKETFEHGGIYLNPLLYLIYLIKLFYLKLIIYAMIIILNIFQSDYLYYLQEISELIFHAKKKIEFLSFFNNFYAVYQNS